MAKLIREQVDFNVAFTMGKKFGTGNWVYYDFERTISIPAPAVCEQFSDRFDCKLYPDLIAFYIPEPTPAPTPEPEPSKE